MIIISEEEQGVPEFVSREAFLRLTLKERDFLIGLYVKRLGREELQRHLYVSRAEYYRMRRRITGVIAEVYGRSGA